MIRFLLNDELIELEHPAPDLTVLDWLRLHKRLTGTKEGCGSGDCGACTAVLVSASDTPSGLPLSYAPANTCILMIGALNGRQLLTVDHLGSSTDLHPVQSALVNHHGSQCGFCTPGFVMSLFALFHQPLEGAEVLTDSDMRHALIEQYLGGNLCRCTGYRPIVDAAIEILDQRFFKGVADRFDAEAARTAAVLWDLQTSSVENSQTVVHVPTSLVDALALWKSLPDAQIVAGGTDVGLGVTQRLEAWSSAIHLSDIGEMNEIRHEPTKIVVGAGVRVSDFLDLAASDYPQAVAMLLRFGSEQVRSQATIGGNLGTASPIGDLPPLLLSLDAGIELVSLNGSGDGLQHRTIPISEYFTGYRETLRQSDEWIYAVHIPVPTEKDVLRVYKVSKRMDDDISSVCASVWLQMSTDATGPVISDVRLAYGGMAAVPQRATDSESVLKGAVLNLETIDLACTALANDFQPISDARSSAAYRMQIAQNLLHRLAIELVDPNVLTDIGSLSVHTEAAE